MKLYDYAYAPNPRRVHIFLAEKGLDMERVEIDLT
ncbi:MAG: glutathione S-transferase, partial [Gammaproteobacteria bacterium]|nr:glutathione S-transferase [Gammaproteobacteria bacterium]